MSDDIFNYRRKADAALADHRHAERAVADEAEALKAAEGRLAVATEGRTVLQGVAKATQEVVHKHISGVVTRCLKAVFGEGAYGFQIEFKEARGKTEAKVSFLRDGQEVIPKDESGGGPLDVASFAVRLACLLLIRPKRRLALMLDQPFGNLSANYQPQVARLLIELCDDFGFQFLIVTHAEGLEVGKVVRL